MFQMGNYDECIKVSGMHYLTTYVTIETLTFTIGLCMPVECDGAQLSTLLDVALLQYNVPV
jgi:hypothetical protein